MPRRVLILGGGTGGVMAARRLVEALRGAGAAGEAEITLVTDSPWHEFRPLYFDVAVGMADTSSVKAPVKSLERYGVKVVLDRVQGINLAERRVQGEKGSYSYDYLVVALGIRYGWDAYPGYAEAGYHNYTLDAALELRAALQRFRGGRVVIVVPEIPHRCGMYPHEAATVIAEGLAKRGVKAEVVMLTAGKKPMGRLGEDFVKVWTRKYEELGIEYVVHNGIEGVDPERRVIRAGNVEERYDLLIKVPPSRLPEPLAKSEGFACKQDPRWACVRPRTFQHPEYDEVYLTGEHSMPPAGLMTAGIPVHFASEYAAEQIAGDIIGGFPVKGLPRIMTCVGYYGASSGLSGSCEISFNEERGTWVPRCYISMVSPLVRIMKEAFYKAWVAALK